MVTQPVRSALIVLALVFGGCFGAMQVDADKPTSAGGLTPNVADKDAGFVAVAPGFDLKAYRTIAVSKFNVTDPVIKDAEDRKLANEMSTFLQSELVRRLRESGLFTRVVNLSETDFRPDAGDKPLRLDGVITRLGEGDQALRAFFGLYGAGKARFQAEMRFVEDGKTWLVTADRREAQMGFFGGSSRDHLRESVDDMARDLMKFLVRLSRGEGPKN